MIPSATDALTIETIILQRRFRNLNLGSLCFVPCMPADENTRCILCGTDWGATSLLDDDTKLRLRAAMRHGRTLDYPQVRLGCVLKRAMPLCGKPTGTGNACLCTETDGRTIRV